MIDTFIICKDNRTHRSLSSSTVTNKQHLYRTDYKQENTFLYKSRCIPNRIDPNCIESLTLFSSSEMFLALRRITCGISFSSFRTFATTTFTDVVKQHKILASNLQHIAETDRKFVSFEVCFCLYS